MTTEQAIALERAYQVLIAQQADLAKKNRVYREFRLFCQTGAVGPIGRRLQKEMTLHED